MTSIDWHVVAFARVPEAGGGCRVAGDDEHFAAAFHEFVSNAEGVFANLGDGEGPVGAVGGVPNVGDGFAGELLHDGAGNGEPTHAGVEDSYWGIIGYFMVSPVFWVSFWLRVSPIVLPIMV